MYSTFLPNLDKTTYLSSPSSSTTIIGSPIVDFGTVMTPIKTSSSIFSYVLPTVIVLVGGYIVFCNPRR